MGNVLRKKARTLAAFGILSILLGVVPTITHAQLGGTAIAQTLTIATGTPTSGDVVAYNRSNETYYLPGAPNDSGLYGIVVAKPLIVLQGKNGTTPVVTSGEAVVNVTNVGGPIAVGDYLTSSTIPGKAQRASASDAYVIGTALQPFSGGTSTSSTSQILVALDFARRPLFSSFNASTSAVSSIQTNVPQKDPTVPAVQVLRYVLAAFIAVGSVYAAFRSFGSNITSSIVSVGRNPLAKSSIQLMVALNAALIVFISLLGLFVALVITLVPL